MHESSGIVLPAAFEGFHRRQRQVYLYFIWKKSVYNFFNFHTFICLPFSLYNVSFFIAGMPLRCMRTLSTQSMWPTTLSSLPLLPGMIVFYFVNDLCLYYFRIICIATSVWQCHRQLYFCSRTFLAVFNQIFWNTHLTLPSCPIFPQCWQGGGDVGDLAVFVSHVRQDGTAGMLGVWRAASTQQQGKRYFWFIVVFRYHGSFPFFWWQTAVLHFYYMILGLSYCSVHRIVHHIANHFWLYQNHNFIHHTQAALKSAEIMQRRASGRPASALEADMDRLFSKKVTVFGPVSLGDSTEVVLNTVLKVRNISCILFCVWC